MLPEYRGARYGGVGDALARLIGEIGDVRRFHNAVSYSISGIDAPPYQSESLREQIDIYQNEVRQHFEK